MSHYFINDSTLDSNIKSYDVEINGIPFRFFTDRGVFSKETLDYGTKFLLETIQFPEDVQSVIDMGCGYGPIGLYVAKMYPKNYVYLYDVNERACALAVKNMKENEIKNAEVHQSFLFEYVNIKADAILTNPPIRAGKLTIFRLYEDAYQKLNHGGLLYVVIQKKQGAPSTVAKLESLFGNCEVVDKSKGYWVLLAKK